ncbi:multiheme c-type cytochrome [Chitinophaga sp. Cy-1792]|uniref:multiheme c-type cytochrome n=1 Tax=Chitinophaga sp. Cy-1792 TaxID=2608339 RepID=UPI001F036F84|nr:multiheme c-type cytochrome [Chitinophaga sp. Cy-1792]
MILSQCVGSKKDERGPAFAGDQACISCHKTVYDSYLKTAHYHASAPASTTTILGSFQSPNDSFVYSGGAVVKAEKADSQFYQTAYTNGQLQQRASFDVVVGQGRNAQTYLSWRNNHYYQLPLSYFKPVNSWVNSPGYPATHPFFERMVPATCFSCHSSYVNVEEKMTGIRKEELFPKNEVMYGINCERCHGPAQEHVAWHSQHPDDKTPHGIVEVGKLSAQQQVDMCALCHSGLLTPQRSLFDFRPGNKLSEFIMADYFATPAGKAPDAHGNQYQLLKKSRCFRESMNQLTCNTCHNAHEDSRDLQAYSLKCMSCHPPESPKFCTNKALPVVQLKQNCIDCHMPVEKSKVITFLTGGENTVADSLRSHYIRK